MIVRRPTNSRARLVDSESSESCSSSGSDSESVYESKKAKDKKVVDKKDDKRVAAKMDDGKAIDKKDGVQVEDK